MCPGPAGGDPLTGGPLGGCPVPRAPRAQPAGSWLMVSGIDAPVPLYSECKGSLAAVAAAKRSKQAGVRVPLPFAFSSSSR